MADQAIYRYRLQVGSYKRKSGGKTKAFRVYVGPYSEVAPDGTFDINQAGVEAFTLDGAPVKPASPKAAKPEAKDKPE